MAIAATEITGTWRPGGYFGHHRSAVRNDFINEYRQRSKPQPPATFIHRAKQAATRHVFSKHDNRERFLNDALYFEQGLGRKRVHDKDKCRKPDFITWHPHKKELLENRNPLTSVYKENFTSGQYNPHRQLYSGTISSNAKIVREALKANELIRYEDRDAFTDGGPQNRQEQFLTTYHKIHGTEDPNKQQLQRLNRMSTVSASCRRVISRARSSQSGRDSVAGCLSWHVPVPRPCTAVVKKPKTLAATPIIEPSMLQPHPPPPRTNSEPPALVI